MIEERQLVFIAAADYTDECRVDVRMRRKHMDLSASQARQFARELVDAAEAAERAAASAVRPVKPAAVDLLGALSESLGREGRAWLPPHMAAQVAEIAAEQGAVVLPAERLSPDCAAGKHPAGWQDNAWDDDADAEVPCECPCHTAGAAA